MGIVTKRRDMDIVKHVYKGIMEIIMKEKYSKVITVSPNRIKKN